MQKQLDDAFGDGRIKVSANSGGLQFKTTVRAEEMIRLRFFPYLLDQRDCLERMVL